jgi:hypothetical protein
MVSRIGFVWVLLVCLGCLPSVENEITEEEQRFDLAEFARSQARELQNQAPSAVKRVKLGINEETVNMGASTQWEKELSLFIQASPKKSLLVTNYQVTEEQRNDVSITRYQANQKAARMQFMELHHQNGELIAVKLKEKEVTLLFDNEKEMYLELADGLCRYIYVSGVQKMIFQKGLAYEVEIAVNR